MNIEIVLGVFTRLNLIFKMFVAGLFVLYLIIIRNRLFEVRPYFLLMPIFIVSYIFVLSPWHFYNYLISPITPFVVVGFFIFYYFACRSNRWVEVSLKSVLVVLIVLNLFTCIIPYIEKMGDKPKVVEIIKKILYFQPGAVFFYPPPMIETASLLGKYTQAKIIYVDKIEPRDLMNCKDLCFLIINDESNPIQVGSSTIDKKLLYANRTWAIFHISAKQKSS